LAAAFLAAGAEADTEVFFPAAEGAGAFEAAAALPDDDVADVFGGAFAAGLAAGAEAAGEVGEAVGVPVACFFFLG
jgi:hypothetical protein